MVMLVLNQRLGVYLNDHLNESKVLSSRPSIREIYENQTKNYYLGNNVQQEKTNALRKQSSPLYRKPIVS